MATALASGDLNGGWLRRLGVVAPAVIIAALFLVVVGNRLDSLYHGNPTGFALFGSHFAQYTHPPRGAVIDSKFGYDGQFFYLQARDPLLLHSSTLSAFRRVGREAFRLQRMGYPLLAYVAVLGNRGALPWALVIVNLVVVVLVTLGFSVYTRSRGWSGWWGLGVGLLTGLLAGTLRDLSDPVAVAAMVGGVLLWQRRRRAWAAALLTLAVLAREPMALAAIGIAAEGLISWWRGSSAGSRRAALRPIVADCWLVVAVPLLAYLGWKAYATARFGGSINSPSSAYLPPFVGIVDEFRHSLDDPHFGDQIWELAYLVLMLAGVAAAARMAWRGGGGVAIAATLFGLSLLVVVFGDPWSYTRLSAPMFAMLLLGGLELRDRPALAVCLGVAVLGAFAPFVPWLGAG